MPSHRALAASLFFLAACDGTGPGARAPVEPVQREANPPAGAASTTPAPGSSAPAVASSAPAAPAVPQLDEYAECPVRVRAVGEGPLDAASLQAASSVELVWPPLCGQVSGWAGISMVRSTEATAFASAGDRFVACGLRGDTCDVIDLASGAVARHIVPSRPNGIDGSPVTSTPEVAALFHQLGAPAPAGTFFFAKDLRISWRLGDAGKTLEVTLVSLETGDELLLHRFPSHAGASEQPIVLEAARLSPDGGVLELDTFTGQGGAGFDVALVNLDAAAAKLFASMATGARRPLYVEKSSAATHRAARHAATFTL